MPVKDWLPAAVRSAAVESKLKVGEPLFHLGDKTAGLYEVIAGRVRLIRVDRSGREIILYVAVAGETIAEASLFSPAYHCDAITASNAMCASIRKLRCSKPSPGIARPRRSSPPSWRNR